MTERMRYILPILRRLGFFCLWCAVCFPSLAESRYYVHLPNGGVDVYPLEFLCDEPSTDLDGWLTFLLVDGQWARYGANDYLECDTLCPPLPYLESFKFSDRLNPTLTQDVTYSGSAADSGSNRTDTIVLAVNSIGKRLVPSFRTSEEEALVYADGILVTSKSSSIRFDHDVHLTVARPEWSTVVLDANGRCITVPFGQDYLVHVDWPADQPDHVARIDIDTDHGENVVGKAEYLHASFRLQGHGVYDDMTDSVWIKGRGNTSWTWPKKPYRLKFDKKVSPFGLTSGKNWVLISNYLSGSMMTNAIAMRVGQMLGVPAANHIIPVELYLNGVYMGSYQWTEKVGFGHNSIDGDDTKGYLVEFDKYYDEPHRFRTTPYALPAGIKAPDLSEWPSNEGDVRKQDIRSDVEGMLHAASMRDATSFAKRVDVDVCARFILANNLCLNKEIYHPKSTYLFRRDLDDAESKILFGPLWDFDWTFGYSGNYTYFLNDQTEPCLPPTWDTPSKTFFGDLLAMEPVRRHYFLAWRDFVERGCVEELQEFVQDYCDFAQPSFANNASRWKDKYDYAASVATVQQWLGERSDYLASITEMGGEGPSGSCGDGVGWWFDTSRHVIYLYGTAERTKYYSSDEKVPWRAFRDSIEVVVISGSIRRLGSRLFAGCSRLEKVVLTGREPLYAAEDAFRDVPSGLEICTIHSEAYQELVEGQRRGRLVDFVDTCVYNGRRQKATFTSHFPFTATPDWLPYDAVTDSVHTSGRVVIGGRAYAVDYCYEATVHKAPLTLTAVDATRRQGEPNPAFVWEAYGWVNGENETEFDVLPVLTCEANELSPPGFYPIIVHEGKARNYEVTYQCGTLTVVDGSGVVPLNNDSGETITYDLAGRRWMGTSQGLSISAGRKTLRPSR